jgi:hypothetical protein
MANLSDMIHGRKPEVAEFIPTDLIEALDKLLKGEMTEWPQIQQLGTLFQNDVFDKLSSAGLDLRSLIGLGSEDAKGVLEAAKPMIKGELPPDVMAQVFRQSAFQNLGTGLMGSPMGGANQARQLGLTSLDMMKQGADLAASGGNAAQRWAQIASGTMMPTSQYMYSPSFFADFLAKQAAAKRDVKQLRYNTAAAPDPAMAHRAAMLASLLGSFAGPGGSSMGNSIAQNPNLNYGSMMSGGVAGAMGGPSGMAGGMSFGGTQGMQFGQPANQGFMTNFGNAFNSTDPNYQTTGVGGSLGGWLGGIFNSGG